MHLEREFCGFFAVFIIALFPKWLIRPSARAGTRLSTNDVLERLNLLLNRNDAESDEEHPCADEVDSEFDSPDEGDNDTRGPTQVCSQHVQLHNTGLFSKYSWMLKQIFYMITNFHSIIFY